jgi:hypothetical protein
LSSNAILFASEGVSYEICNNAPKIELEVFSNGASLKGTGDIIK